MNNPERSTTSRRRRWALPLGAAVMVAVALIAVLSLVVARQRNTAVTADAEAGTAASTAPGAKVGNAVAPLTATDTDGHHFAVPGSQPVVLYFMAPWCSSCLSGAQAMATVAGDYAGKASFVTVDVTPDDNAATVAHFRHTARATNPYVVDSSGAFLQRYGVQALDTTVVVSPDGQVLKRVDGRSLDAQALRSLLDTAHL